jgi:AcrR family transcriptional regulator
MPRTEHRRLRADAARNRQQLLETAREAFSRHGVGASLDDVARAAGVGPGTLYRHFPSRDELVLAVIDDGLAEMQTLGDELLKDSDAAHALRRWVGAYIEQLSVFQGLAATLVNPPACDERHTCRQALATGTALIDAAASAGVIRADVDANDVLDMAAAIAWIGEQPNRGARHRKRLLELLLAGLQNPPAERFSAS